MLNNYQLFTENDVESVCQLIRRKSDAYVHITVDMEDYYRIKGDKEMIAAQADR